MVLTRRQFAIATVCAAAGARAAEAAVAGFALAPNVTDRWAVHENGAATLIQLGDGVTLAAGRAGPPSRNGLAIWSRSALPGDFQISFATSRLDASQLPRQSGLFFLLYFGVHGDGTVGHPASVADWPADTVPYSHDYAAHISGARIAFYRQFKFGSPDDGSPTPIGLNGIAPLSAAYFAKGRRTVVVPDSAIDFPGLRGVAYRWTVRRSGNRVSVLQQGGGGSRGVAFTSAGFSQYANSGGVGLLVSPGRSVEIHDLAVG